MDAVSYSHSAKQAQRIEKFIENPDSTSGIVTVPKVIGAGESVTVPAGRVAVLPNVQVDGVLDVQGEVFIPAGSSYSDTEVDATVVKQDGNIVANDVDVVHKTGDETIAGIKTFSSSPIVPTPTTGTQAVNKDYADLKVELASFTGANQSLSRSGYQKLPGGLIIQWNQIVVTSTSAEIFNLPISFTTNFFIGTTSQFNSTTGTAICDIMFLNKSQIALRSNYANYAISYIVIGY